MLLEIYCYQKIEEELEYKTNLLAHKKDLYARVTHIIQIGDEFDKNYVQHD